MQKPEIDFGMATGAFDCPIHGKQKNVFAIKAKGETHYYCPYCIFKLLQGAEVMAGSHEPQS